jgi:hypothetical protein
MEHEPILALFQRFEPLFGSWYLDPEQHQGEKSDPHPHKKIRIRIRIKVMRIHNTAFKKEKTKNSSPQ